MSNQLIKNIKIGIRIREDLGDIQELAESIEKRGLLHPIVIDENLSLIAGHRRLEAHKLLGLEEIETRTLSDLSEKEKRLIELEENTKRKALTEYEASKNLNELANAAKEILKDEFSPPSGDKQNMEKGRPEKPDSLEKVAGFIGIPRQTITEARQHVQAVEKFPVLETLPKKEAIKVAKEPEKIEQYQKAVEEFPELREIRLPVNAAIKAAENLRQVPESVRLDAFRQAKEVAEKSKSEQRRIDDEYKHMKKIDQLITGSLQMHGTVTEERLEAWFSYCLGREGIEEAISRLQYGIDELSKLQNKLRERLQGPRKVVGISEVRS